MDCCQCQGIETFFNKKRAVKELRKYRKKGPLNKTTRMLIDALKAEGVNGMTLLDIGGGIGTIQHELLNAGARGATNVDASTKYIEAAVEEAERQGHSDRSRFYHGDFVELAAEIDRADIVTLDRVICCYHDMQKLVGLSSARAGKLYGVVYPRDTWWTKIILAFGNFIFWVLRNPFRIFVHPTAIVDAIIREEKLERRFYVKTAIWQVVVYSR